MNYTITYLIQGTEEWLDFRKDKIGASESHTIMGLTPKEWTINTPFKLWKYKLGLAEGQKLNYAMERGIELEQKARKAFSKDFGMFVKPETVQSKDLPWMIASLDGLSVDGNSIVEIKCASDKVHQDAKNGILNAYYMCQVQHQLAVTGLDMAYFYSFDGVDGVGVPVMRDEEFIKELVNKEKLFMDCLISKTAPALIDGSGLDFLPMDDNKALVTKTDEWKAIKEALAPFKDLEEKEKALREEIWQIAGQNATANGIKIQEIFRKGNVDYKKAMDSLGIAEVDLEPYRKEPTSYCSLKATG